MTRQDVIDEFHKEFGPIKYLFDTYVNQSPVAGQKPEREEYVKPGVYVYLFEGEVIKVGKHNINSFKRSLEHIRDGTTEKKNGGLNMTSLSGNPNLQIIYFNVREPKYVHWVIALEDYLEVVLNPRIPSLRRC